MIRHHFRRAFFRYLRGDDTTPAWTSAAGSPTDGVLEDRIADSRHRRHASTALCIRFAHVILVAIHHLSRMTWQPTPFIHIYLRELYPCYTCSILLKTSSSTTTALHQDHRHIRHYRATASALLVGAITNARQRWILFRQRARTIAAWSMIVFSRYSHGFASSPVDLHLADARNWCADTALDNGWYYWQKTTIVTSSSPIRVGAVLCSIYARHPACLQARDEEDLAHLLRQPCPGMGKVGR